MASQPATSDASKDLGGWTDYLSSGILARPLRPDEQERFLACIDLLCCVVGRDIHAMEAKELRLFWDMATSLIPAFRSFENGSSFEIFRSRIAISSPFGFSAVKRRGRPSAVSRSNVAAKDLLQLQELLISFAIEKEREAGRNVNKTHLAETFVPMKIFCGLKSKAIKKLILEVEQMMDGKASAKLTQIQLVHQERIAQEQHSLHRELE